MSDRQKKSAASAEPQDRLREGRVEIVLPQSRNTDVSVASLLEEARAFKCRRDKWINNGVPVMYWYRDDCKGVSQGHVSRLLKALSVWEEAGELGRHFLYLMNRDALYSLLYAPPGTLGAAMAEYENSKPTALNRAFIERVKASIKASAPPMLNVIGELERREQHESESIYQLNQF